MEMQQSISTARLARKVGREIEVLIDEVDDDGAVGRSAGDAPEIDGVTYVDSDDEIAEGTIARHSPNLSRMP